MHKHHMLSSKSGYRLQFNTGNFLDTYFGCATQLVQVEVECQ